MTTRSLLSSFFALGLAAGACNNEPPSLDSGISGSKQGSELTPAEQAQFCEAADAFGDEVFPPSEQRSAGCTFAGIFGALAIDGSVDSCKTLRDACLAEEPEPEPATCDLGVEWATCMATVAEIEACYEEFAQDHAAVMRAFSCDKMVEYQTTMPSMDASLGEHCSRAKAKCPTVLGV